jgi:ABC-2 type transport system permease protein
VSVHAYRRALARAFGTDPRHFAALTRILALTQFKLRYLDSALSYLWCVARPFTMFAVLYVVFTQLGRFNQGIPHYHLYLLTSIVLWTFFAEATATGVGSLVSRGGLLRKLPVPHLVIPLSVVARALLDLGMNLIALFVFVFAAGLTPRVGWLELPLLIAMLAVFVTGATMLLSALYVRYRDVNQLWMVVSQALFFFTPIFYGISALPGDLRTVALFNPLASLFTEARHALIDPAAPSAAEAIGGTELLLVPAGVVIAVCLLGLWVFTRESPWVAENL